MKYLPWLLIAILFNFSGCSNEQEKQREARLAAAAKVGDAAKGQQIAATSCALCHGEDGVHGTPGTPFLAGQQPDYIRDTLRSYINADRNDPSMREAVTALSLEDMGDVAAYYANLHTDWPGAGKQAKTKPAAKGNSQAGQDKAKVCGSCHGYDGNSSQPEIPNLALLQPSYFIKALNYYLDGDRIGAAIMRHFKQTLTRQDMDNLAAYFAEQKPSATTFTGNGNAGKGEKLADQLCVGCHGKEGNSYHPDIPSLAGQSANYLNKALNAYVSRERKDPMMNSIVDKLTPEVITNLATYYATRKPEQTRPSTTVSVSADFAPVAQGEKIAGACNGCHGARGNSLTGEIPRLTGLSPQYLVAAISAYQKGGRPHATMQPLVSHLNALDVEKLALYYASQAPSPDSVQGRGNAAQGEKAADSCFGCHGAKGVSEQALTPSLAGQNADYLIAAIQAYAKGERNHKDMQNAAKELDKQTILNLASYFAAQKAEPVKVRQPESPQQIVDRCNRCHGETGHSSDPRHPRLAGQSQEYLAKALTEYQQGKRINVLMQAMSEVLWQNEIAAVAAYYANLP